MQMDMKRFLTLLAAAAAVLAASCQKDDTSAPGRQSGEVDIAIKASLPQAIGTYAVSSDSGKGGAGNVDPAENDLRYIMEVWTKGDAPVMVYRDVQSVADWTQTSSKTFNARLLAKEYDFVFWADFVTAGSLEDNHYRTTALNKVDFMGDYAINKETRDAYYGRQTVDLTDQGATIGGIVLKRPFGKLRLIATDKPANTGATAPTQVSIMYGDNTFYKAFNALGGAVCDTRSAHPATLSCVARQENGVYLLAHDYILAADDVTSLSGVTVQITVNGETFTKKLPTFPVSANKLTTVKGNFYTNEGTLTVSVDDEFAEEVEKEIPVEKPVSTISEAGSAITAAAAESEGRAVRVTVAQEVTAPATVAIPETVTATTTPEITLDLSGAGIADGNTLTVGDVSADGQSTETAFAGTISVIVPKENVGSLEIKAPNAHVTINGKYTNVTAKTSASTLVIEKGTVIETLTVEAGNVEIYGTVVNPIVFNDETSVVTVYGTADAAALKAAAGLAAANRCKKIQLLADIDLEGAANNRWIPIDTEKSTNFKEFDGNGHTIRGLYVDNTDSGEGNADGYYYGGLFYVLRGTVRDLTIDGAAITCFRGGALVGRMDCGLLENCKIKNVTVKGEQKMAGLAGFVSFNENALTVRGCSVENCAFKTGYTNGDGLGQSGGLIGYLQTSDRNVLIENNSVSGISFDKAYEPAESVTDKVWAMEQQYSHAFIGTIANFTTQASSYDTYTIELRNNRVAQQVSGIPACDRTDDYIGWWGGDYNTSRYPYSIKLVVDGVVKDRWVELKRLAAQIAAGGEVTIHRSYDLSVLDGAVEVTKPTTISLNDNVVVSSVLESTYIINNSQLTIEAGANAAVNFGKRIVENRGTLTVNGGTYTTVSHESGTAFWNNDGKALLTLNNVHVVAGMFAVAGTGTIDINGGVIKSTSSNKYGNWAYCIRAQEGGTMTIDDATVEGVQGCIASIEGSRVTVTNVKVSARNSEPNRQDAFYALYSASDADLEVISGEFYSDRTPCCLASNDDNPENPFGGFMLKGGKYSSQPIDGGVNPSKVWEPEAGYKYVSIAEGDFKYEIVKE